MDGQRQRSNRGQQTARYAAVAMAGIVVIGVTIWILAPRRTAVSGPVTVKVAVPAGSALADPGRLLGPPVISPDGRTIAVSLKTGTTSRVFVRRLESDRLTDLPA